MKILQAAGPAWLTVCVHNIYWPTARDSQFVLCPSVFRRRHGPDRRGRARPWRVTSNLLEAIVLPFSRANMQTQGRAAEGGRNSNLGLGRKLSWLRRGRQPSQ